MHEHDWSPISDARGRYRCGVCGARGYRNLVAGTIDRLKAPSPERVPVTRRPSTQGGAVPRLPTLDDYDRRRD